MLHQPPLFPLFLRNPMICPHCHNETALEVSYVLRDAGKSINVCFCDNCGRKIEVPAK